MQDHEGSQQNRQRQESHQNPLDATVGSLASMLEDGVPLRISKGLEHSAPNVEALESDWIVSLIS